MFAFYHRKQYVAIRVAPDWGGGGCSREAKAYWELSINYNPDGYMHVGEVVPPSRQIDINNRDGLPKLKGVWAGMRRSAWPRAK